MALVRIKLADSDRERYGLTDLEFDVERRTLKEVRELGQQVGLDWPTLRAGLLAEDDIALGVVCWLAIRRAGVDVAWNDFDLELTGLRGEEVAENPNSSAPDGAKPKSTRSPRTSRASTASSRGKSNS